jgi:phytoene dehydrogenase-like protein
VFRAVARQYKLATALGRPARPLRRHGDRHDRSTPEHPRIICTAGINPLDWNAISGDEGNIFQGELTLEQLFFARPVPGGRSTNAHSRSMDVRSRRSAGHHGRPAGTQRCDPR